MLSHVSCLSDLIYTHLWSMASLVHSVKREKDLKQTQTTMNGLSYTQDVRALETIVYYIFGQRPEDPICFMYVCIRQGHPVIIQPSYTIDTLTQC